MAALGIPGDNPGGGIKTPPPMQELQHANCLTMGSHNPPTDREVPERDREQTALNGVGEYQEVRRDCLFCVGLQYVTSET